MPPLAPAADFCANPPVDAAGPITEFARRVLAGQPASDEAWRDHLIDVHTRVPALTSRWATQLRDHQGRTSYEVLAAVVDGRDAPTGLDLGCGDRPLLDALLP